MGKCPNCGRETARTEDWCCQWFGYPLLSGSYKKISKTYRQLKEERLPSPLEVEEPEPVPVLEAELEPVSEPEAVSEPEPEPVLEIKPEAESTPESIPETATKPKPRIKRKPAAKRKSAPKSKPEAKSKPAAKAEPAPEPESEPEAELEPVSEPEPAPASIEVTVAELLYAYESDGEAADARFADKILRVTGVVDRIEVKDTLDINYITLTTTETNLLQNVRCTFDKKYGPELNQLAPGQMATVQGKYDGSIIDISLRDCVLVH